MTIVNNSGRPLEVDIQNAICEVLMYRGIFFWRSNNIPVFGKNKSGNWTYRSMGKYAVRGVPDIICIHNGKFIGLEVKRDKKSPLSEYQETFRDNLITNGGYYYVLTSTNDLLQVHELGF